MSDAAGAFQLASAPSGEVTVVCGAGWLGTAEPGRLDLELAPGERRTVEIRVRAE